MRFRSLKRLTEPAVEPVTLAEAKKHLRVEHDADDALITASIVAAREWCETYLDATLIHTQWQMTLDFFPVYIRLPKPPMATTSRPSFWRGRAPTSLNQPPVQRFWSYRRWMMTHCWKPKSWKD